jgi:hypothetical protein
MFIILVLTNELPPETVSNDRYCHRRRSRSMHLRRGLYSNGSIGEQYSSETCHEVDAMLLHSSLASDTPVLPRSSERTASETTEATVEDVWTVDAHLR